jgi:hypothetical protein
MDLKLTDVRNKQFTKDNQIILGSNEKLAKVTAWLHYDENYG